MPQNLPKVIGQSGAKELIRRLHHLKRDWPSEPELYELDPRTITALLEYIATEETLRPKIAGYLLIFFGAFAIFLGCASLVAALFPISMALVLLGAFIYDPGPGQRLATYALTQTDDLRVLPALIQGTRFAWGKHPEVIRAITRLLEHVREADAGLLNGRMQEMLWRLAVPSLYSGEHFDETLPLRTLQALALIGNRNSLRQMQALGATICTYAQHQRISWKALELAPIMEARLLRQEVPETLLRAADMPTSQPETLLRATHPTNTERPQQLLRASQSEQEETQA